METEKRRSELLSLLHETGNRITGTDLAHKFGVSRQVIVQDIAILRAQGEHVLATPGGYLIPQGQRSDTVQAVLACIHTREQIAQELGIIVDLGARVLDVIVEHPVYGEMRGNLMIASRRDLAMFVERLSQTKANPLSALTGGVHLHTIEAPNRAAVEEITAALCQAGFLVS